MGVGEEAGFLYVFGEAVGGCRAESGLLLHLRGVEGRRGCGLGYGWDFGGKVGVDGLAGVLWLAG